jgi:O-antigen/teichoic acid export membrane protein
VAIVKLRGDKLTANAFYLAAATILTSVLGLVFWALAARSHGHGVDTSQFGRAYAEISALTLLAIVSQFNLTNVFARFLPTAGSKSIYFVRRGYTGVTITALLLGVIFVVTPLATKVVPSGAGARILFIVSVALFAIFALQDSVLTALRITHWVPIENTTFSIVKLGLLAGFVTVLSLQTAIVVAWVLPVVVAVILVNWLLFTVALPAHSKKAEGSLPPRRTLLSFVAAEYLSTLCGVGSSALLPLIVIWKVGAIQEAYFAVPWLVAIAISNVFWNINMSFIVETVTAGEHSAHRLRRTYELWLGLVVVVIVACTIVGPTVLGLLGPMYEKHGGTLLRLIGLSAPFTFITVAYQAFAWLDRRVWWLLANSIARAIAFLALSLVLLPDLGITGVGWAYLITQAGSALLMAPSVWTHTRTIFRSPTPVRLVRDDEPARGEVRTRWRAVPPS